MSRSEIGSFRDPNSFSDHEYSIQIDYELSVDGEIIADDKPPIKTYSWEEFQEKAIALTKEFPEDEFEYSLSQMETYIDTETFETVFRCMIWEAVDRISLPFVSRSHFDVLNERTLDDLMMILRYTWIKN